MTEISVVKAGAPLEWVVLENPPGDQGPPGEEFVAFRSADRIFSTGLWRREPETGRFEREYHEIAYIVEGEVDVEGPDGRVLEVVPGDILVTPMGSKGVWRARSKVTKLWAVHHASSAGDTEIRVVRPGGREGWRELAGLAGEIPSRAWDLDAFADGPFSTGMWEREPDTWTFERPHDEVALITDGEAEI